MKEALLSVIAVLVMVIAFCMSDYSIKLVRESDGATEGGAADTNLSMSGFSGGGMHPTARKAAHARELSHPPHYRRPASAPPISDTAHTPHWRRDERFEPMLSPIEERHMGPDAAIDIAYGNADMNSIYDEFVGH